MTEALEDLEALLKKKYKKCIVKRGSDPTFQIGRVSTGLIGLDTITGGGIPVGRLTQFQGPDASGKSTIGHHIINYNQRINPEFTACWIAAEGFDGRWAEKIGVDLDRVEVVYPTSGEEGLDMALSTIDHNKIDFLIIDSVAALIPTAEAEGDMDDQQMGIHARMMGKFCRKLGASFNKASYENPCRMPVVVINQVREQIGRFKAEPKAGGGWSLKHTKSLDLYFRLGELIQYPNNPIIYGRTIKTKVVKSKVSPPYGVAELRLYTRDDPVAAMTEGEIDIASDLRIYGVEYGVVTLKGAWFHYDGQKYNGKADFTKFLRDNPDKMAELRSQIEHIALKK